MSLDDSQKLSLYYSAAGGSVPIKIFTDRELLSSIADRKCLIPIHIQLNPTNKCNLNCEWCSCSERNRDDELSIQKMKDVMSRYQRLGSKSVTVTGGGEPLLHPHINKLIEYMHDELQLKIGLVTNGTCVEKLAIQNWNRLSWVRFSLGDSENNRKVFGSTTYWNNLDRVVKEASSDFSFSYVVTEQYNPDRIAQAIRFANEHNFSHIRMTTNILAGDQGDLLEKVQEKIGKRVNDRLVLYQDRGVWSRGNPICYLSLLKPVVGADGKLYPCCGSQYILEEPTRDYYGTMGTTDAIETIYKDQSFFDGSQCFRCFYQHYNFYLGILMNGLKHKEFL